MNALRTSPFPMRHIWKHYPVIFKKPLQYVSELLGPKMKLPILNQNVFYVILTGKIKTKLLLELYSILIEILMENAGVLI